MYVSACATCCAEHNKDKLPERFWTRSTFLAPVYRKHPLALLLSVLYWLSFCALVCITNRPVAVLHSMLRRSFCASSDFSVAAPAVIKTPSTPFVDCAQIVSSFSYLVAWRMQSEAADKAVIISLVLASKTAMPTIDFSGLAGDILSLSRLLTACPLLWLYRL